MTDLLLVIVGVVLLAAGGEGVVRGSLSVAKRRNMSPLLVGLVIVGFGTSAPELVVSVDAALNQRPDIAIGNIVGSNIGNVLLILGVCALVTPLAVRPLALHRDAVVVVAASVLFVVLVGGAALARSDALVFLAAFAAYLVWAYRSERREAAPDAEVRRAEASELSHLPPSGRWATFAIVAGLVSLVGGSRVLLIGAIGMAERVGVSDAAIGLTLVAVGTSLPELSVSLIAAYRRHADVAIGNVLGSNIFNLLGILGISALLQPLPVHARIVQFDQWVMLGAALVVLVFLSTGRRLTRLEGGALVVGYGLYAWLGLTVFGG